MNQRDHLHQLPFLMMNADIYLRNKKFESYACIMRMVLHDPERIKKCLIAPLAGLGGVLSNALKTVSQVRSGQAGNIARAEERSVKMMQPAMYAGAFSLFHCLCGTVLDR